MLKKVLLIGGNEKQQRVIDKGLGLPEGIEVITISPRWTSNWDKPAAEVERKTHDIDAIAMTTDVPTLLGRAVRRTAGRHDIPWRSRPARGRSALCNLVIDAARAAKDD